LPDTAEARGEQVAAEGSMQPPALPGEDSQVADPPSPASEPAGSEFPDRGMSMAGRSGYLPVAEHGLIGDLHCVALVGTNGTIDWHCCPSFDAPSMFGSLLDADRGGCFELAAAVPAKTRQFYLPDTNVLITRFLAPDGVGEIQDFSRSAPRLRRSGIS
jgi:hypothetical protein